MTPSRKNKQYLPESTGGRGAIKSSTNTNFQSMQMQQRAVSRQNYQQQQQQRWDQSRQSVRGIMTAGATMNEKYQHPNINSSDPTRSQNGFSNHNRIQKKINKNDHIEFIPLFVLSDACRENSERKVREICRKLMLLEADEAEPVVNFQDQTGRTALSYACGGGTINIIEEVSRFRFINPNLADNDGNAPLHYSSVSGHYEGVDFLVRRFNGVIDVNVRNASGLTPLMKAALQGRTKCARRLLSAGASPFLKDYIRGLTAAEWARLCGRHICEEIINHSAPDARMENSTAMSPVFGRKPNSNVEESYRNRFQTDESAYYHLYARSTVHGAKWLKNKIKKVLGASVRSGEDKSYVFDNPLVKSLADKRPQDKNYSALTNLGLGGAAVCAGSLLLPEVQPMVHHQKQRPKKITIPSVQITPVRR